MGNSLQEERLENTTRLLFFKHRGDLVRVLEELRTIYEHEVENIGDRITLDFVKKVIKKFKKQQQVNDPYVATWIMEYIYSGTKQREVDWQADDQELEGHKFIYRSVCCDKAVERRRVNEEEFFVCLKCNIRCQVYRIPNLDVFEMKKRIRVEKRNDELQLIKAVESLGFCGEKPPVIKQTNFQVFTGETPQSRKRVKSLPVEDHELIAAAEDMDSRDRETVIKQLEKIKKDIDNNEQS